MSLDCFEKNCMLLIILKGDDALDYFIILKKFINYYRIYFANNINTFNTRNLTKSEYNNTYNFIYFEKKVIYKSIN